MKRNIIAIACLVCVLCACDNSGSGAGAKDTSVKIGTNPSSGTVDTGTNGTNGYDPHTPNNNNNFQSPATTNNDTLSKQ